jgi:hypothetical protein
MSAETGYWEMTNECIRLQFREVLCDACSHVAATAIVTAGFRENIYPLDASETPDHAFALSETFFKYRVCLTHDQSV